MNYDPEKYTIMARIRQSISYLSFPQRLIQTMKAQSEVQTKVNKLWGSWFSLEHIAQCNELELLLGGIEFQV